MVYKRVSKIIFAAILAVTVFSGCGNRQEEGIDKTETETTTQKSTQDSTQDVTQEAEEETKYPSITSDGKIKDYKSVVTVDDTAYELYTYLDKVADNYAKSVNKVADTLAGKSDVYDLVIPLSSGITFPDNLKDKISSSDQHDAMQKIQDSQQELTLQDPERRLYSRAAKMVELGADLDEVMSECELPQAEAELLISLRKGRT